MTSERMIILSACRPEYDVAGNLARTLKLHQQLHWAGLRPRKATGCYQGQLEDSFVLNPVSGKFWGKEWGVIMSLARRWEQETVLVVTAASEAFLVDPEGKRPLQMLGQWREVQGEPAGRDYTQTGDTYYVCD